MNPLPDSDTLLRWFVYGWTAVAGLWVLLVIGLIAVRVVHWKARPSESRRSAECRLDSDATARDDSEVAMNVTCRVGLAGGESRDA